MNGARPPAATLESMDRVLGKLGPSEQDRKWFGDIRQAVVRKTADLGTYTRMAVDLPIEKDFLQPHLLLLPKKQGRPFPAVVCWTSTTPDYTEPEKWWGKWLAEHGYVVLTGWSFIRHYRDDSTYRTGAAEKLHERFGHWLPMAKMVHDAQREAEYLRSLKEVDGARIGFMGFSLSAKAALYVAAFAPEITATVSVDPHIAVNGGTNWYAPWYLDWPREYPDIPTPQHTVLSLLNPDPGRPGFEHNHHEILALAAPRPLLIGGTADSEDSGGDSDDRQSWGYYNRAKEVYRLVGVADNLRFVLTNNGHHANGPEMDSEWRAFLDRHRRPRPAPLLQTYSRYLEEGIGRVEARLAARPSAGLKEIESEPGWRTSRPRYLRRPCSRRRTPPAPNALASSGWPKRSATSSAASTTPDTTRAASTITATRTCGSKRSDCCGTTWTKRAGRVGRRRFLGADADGGGRSAYAGLPALPVAVYRHFAEPLLDVVIDRAARLTGVRKPEWEQLTRKVLHRFAAEEQTPDGYWGEHSSAGPTTGYDYVTTTGVAMYWELTQDPPRWKRSDDRRRSTRTSLGRTVRRSKR